MRAATSSSAASAPAVVDALELAPFARRKRRGKSALEKVKA